jgi:hypothetical protein
LLVHFKIIYLRFQSFALIIDVFYRIHRFYIIILIYAGAPGCINDSLLTGLQLIHTILIPLAPNTLFLFSCSYGSKSSPIGDLSEVCHTVVLLLLLDTHQVLVLYFQWLLIAT